MTLRIEEGHEFTSRGCLRSKELGVALHRHFGRVLSQGQSNLDPIDKDGGSWKQPEREPTKSRMVRIQN